MDLALHKCLVRLVVVTMVIEFVLMVMLVKVFTAALTLYLLSL